MKKIKVMTLIARLNIGGPAINVIYINSLLPKEKYETMLVSGVESEDEGNMLDLAAEYKVEPVIIQELRREINLKKDFTSLVKIVKLILKFKPDIIHTHTAKAGTLGRIAGILTGVKVKIHTFHGHVFEGYFSPLRTKIFLNIEKFLAKFTDRIISVSDSQKKDFIGLGIGNDKKIVNVPLGLNLEEFDELDKHKGQLRKEFGISDDCFLIGIIARLVAIKNHKLLINVFKQVKKKVDKIKLIIVGDGYLRKELEQITNEEGLANDIIFTGFRDDLIKIYADIDLNVLCSLNEGLPTTIIEAQYCRVPVVASNVGGVSDLIENNVTGILTEKEDEPGLIEGILRIIHDKELYRSIQENAHLISKKKYGLDILIRNIDNIYIDSLK